MKIYVGNLSKQVTDAQFAELGGPYGALTSSVVVRERIGNESRGFGFLEYASNDEGKAAIAGLNGKVVADQTLKVNEARTSPAKPLRGRY